MQNTTRRQIHTFQTWYHDIKQVVLINLLLLAMTGILSLILFILRGMSVIEWLYTLRGVSFVEGSLGLFMMAGLLISDKTDRKAVKDVRYESYFYALPFPFLLTECAIWLIGIGLFIDLGIRIFVQ
ncbi:MAG: hypothetical protein Q4E24_15045 [bacterium]|nr:hypothetical protein [bacterium]